MLVEDRWILGTLDSKVQWFNQPEVELGLKWIIQNSAWRNNSPDRWDPSDWWANYLVESQWNVCTLRTELESGTFCKEQPGEVYRVWDFDPFEWPGQPGTRRRREFLSVKWLILLCGKTQLALEVNFCSMAILREQNSSSFQSRKPHHKHDGALNAIIHGNRMPKDFCNSKSGSI